MNNVAKLLALKLRYSDTIRRFMREQDIFANCVIKVIPWNAILSPMLGVRMKGKDISAKPVAKSLPNPFR